MSRILGFRLEKATGTSVAIKSPRKNGAPVAIDLDQLLGTSPRARRKHIQDRSDRKVTDRVNRAVQSADTIDGLHAALEPVLDKNAIPDRVLAGGMVLQPSEARRRSGSHYTPRSLTEPIVHKTLGPVLADVRRESGGSITPDQILELKVCDPAMGSGAFLVEACRQLGDELVEAHRVHGHGALAQDGQDDTVAARRLVAQRCLFGVDRNVVAVDLAKMSLWLVTLARDLPLTFLDHALRHGDSLLGLTRRQIDVFDWSVDDKPPQFGIWDREVRQSLEAVEVMRRQIREAAPDTPHESLRSLWQRASIALDKVRLIGDILLAAFFSESKPRLKKQARSEYGNELLSARSATLPNPLEDRRFRAKPLASFHWETEFPEVFGRDRPGFDAIVGNPPFAGKNSVIGSNVAEYPSWLKTMHPASHGNADLAAHFFRRAFNLLRDRGCLGLIATNTIAQGDTRSTGLQWICRSGGAIYDVTRRLAWPGQAAVVVSVIHVCRGVPSVNRILDNVAVDGISAFLLPGDHHDDPARIERNAQQSFVGSYVLGMGFTFDDTDSKGVASSIAEMERLVVEDPRNKPVIFPYIGGEELNTHPTHSHHRYAINFRDYPLRRNPDKTASWKKSDEEQRTKWLFEGTVPYDYPGPVAEDWPDLLRIVRERVRPIRAKQHNVELRNRWWRHARHRPHLHAAIEGLDRVLAVSRVGQFATFAFVPTGMLYADSLIIFPFDCYAAFCALQSRPHELWARRFGSSMKEDLRYTPSDCFETFPFPEDWHRHSELEYVGRQYYEYRANLMTRHSLGLTKLYNRFHDRDDRSHDIVSLRAFHEQMDQAMLQAYGWTDISAECEFVLDYDEEIESTLRRKKHWRYRWPKNVQDEILARLIALNAEQYMDGM